MAIDKSRTKPWMKVVIVFFAVAMVMSVASFALIPLLAPSTTTQSGTTGSQSASGTLDAIASTWTEAIAENEKAIAKDPKNYDLLIQQANMYHDYAGQVLEAGQKNQSISGAAVPIFLAAIRYYEQALAVKPGDTSVMTDLAISRFYTGDTQGAIDTALLVLKIDPKFAPARFNLGIFYAQSGQSAQAIAEFENYLEMEPDGQSAAAAKDMISQIKAAPNAGTQTQGSGQTGTGTTQP